MFGKHFWGSRFYGPRYFGPGDAEAVGGFVSDNLGAGAGHRKRRRYEDPIYILPPSRSDEELRKEREERKRRLQRIAARQEAIREAEASRELLEVLKRKSLPFRKRITAAQALYEWKFALAPLTAETTKLSAMLTDTLADDETSKWERPVSKSEINRQVADLWMEDPEEFERLWPHVMETA